ncbi:Tryptophan synthase alpha chain [Hondaea fermentalgiana]|uniref:tryptophan synthase n=1 Tax=Hondaea fermentalgiana TaxID=2315210 RepID=A0A2R5GMX3_9STRA|nr:Tryptophan synthase alpha chain [Hondaea fermentalgiana]|eukprot:GBG31078.1 Tryptophan synthase alpha chain [Hondaea fermentalgiana]
MTIADLEKTFAKTAEEKRAAFIPYVTAGYPEKAATVPIMLAMQEGGADVIELGMPFSDPLADGPVVQESSFVALQHGVTVADCLAMVKEARGKGLTVPVILMGYWNPFAQYGEEKLVEDCREATISGFIAVDLSGPEAERFAKTCAAGELAYVPLVAPTSTDKRLGEVAQFGSGYVYCVSVTGITGARDKLPEDLKEFTDRVKSHFKIPLAVGFGLNTRQHVVEVNNYADGAVMGSVVIKTIKNAGESIDAQCDAVRSFVKSVTSDE